MEYRPHPYQAEAAERICISHGFALWMEMGLGKTATTLLAIDRLLGCCDAYKVLIIAPKKVAEATWQAEGAKWDNFRHLRFATVLGSEKQREAALAEEADIYVTNRENVVWLADRYGRRWPFDTVVIDEASSFKNHAAQRFKALRKMLPHIERVIELTGTPAPNNLLDVWAQIFLLDGGQRLGKYFGKYREEYFQPDKRSSQQVFSWKLKPKADELIRSKLTDVVLSLKATDHISMPELIIDDIPVVLDPDAVKQYRRLEEKMLLPLDGTVITAQQAATLTGKLLQLCNGALYDEQHVSHPVHSCKVEALMELLESLDGQPALVFYSFEFDLAAIRQALAKTKLRVGTLSKGSEDVDAWNAGKYDVLLAHPASCAYGLNLQSGGHHLVWYGLPWSLELYQQGTARLYRQGQAQPVIVHRLIAQGCTDEDVVAALDRKDRCQEALMQALKARIRNAKGAKP